MYGIQKMVSGTQNAALPSDFAWLATVSTAPLVYANARYPYRSDLAQIIRESAGPDGHSPLGLQTGVTIGTSGTLAATNPSRIQAETILINIVSSGTGTKGDPYIVQDRSFDGGAGNFALWLDDPDATYHVKFVNCVFFDGAQNAFRTNLPTTVELENCEVYNTVANAYAIRIDDGDVYLDRVEISGAQEFAVINVTGGALFHLRNVHFNTDNSDYEAGTDLILMNSSGTCRLDARYIDFDAGGSANMPDSAVSLYSAADGSSVQDFIVKDCASGIIDDTFSGPNTTDNIVIRNFDIKDPTAEAIRLSNGSGMIGKGECDHTLNGAGSRLIHLVSDVSNDAIRVQNFDIEYVKATKKTGSGSGNECIQSSRGENCRIRYCWVTECTEDAFEHVSVISGNTIEYVVADNCEGQIADFFLQYDESSWGLINDTSTLIDSECYCHHIYGDCNNYGLIISGIKGFTFHDIYADNAAATSGNNDTVRIEDRTIDTVQYEVRDVKGSGPMALPASRGGNAVNISTAGSQGVEVRYFDNESGVGAPITSTA